MRKLFSSKSRKENNTPAVRSEQQQSRESISLTVKGKRILYASLMVVAVVCATIALRIIISEVQEDAEARQEYQVLRERFPEVSRPVIVEDEPVEEIAPAEEVEEEEEEYERIRELRDMSLDELSSNNRDFVGWINALQTIDYPVVRGRDNIRYLNTTFHGGINSAGTIFMDYRHLEGFDEHVSILYGHNGRDGSMFAGLINYLNPNFLRNNPIINVTTRDGRTLSYRVFDARLTDAWDSAYTIGISDTSRAASEFTNAPANTSHFLLLSTCTRSNDYDERVLVFAALT